MVGRRGETLLVPPYRLRSPNKAMARREMMFVLNRWRLSKIRSTFIACVGDLTLRADSQQQRGLAPVKFSLRERLCL